MTTIGQGLTFAGASLARAIMERKAQKKQQNEMAALVQALFGSKMTPEQVPGYRESMPGYPGQVDMMGTQSVADAATQDPQSAASQLASALLGASPKQQAAVAPAIAQQAGNVQANAGAVADKYNKSRELAAAMIQSGDPEMKAQAISMLFPQEKAPVPLNDETAFYNGEFIKTKQPSMKIEKTDDGKLWGINTRTGEKKLILETDPRYDVKTYKGGTPDGEVAMFATVFDKKGNQVRTEMLADPWDPNPTQRILTGELPMSPRTKGTLEEKYINTSEALARLDNLIKPYNPSNPEAGGFKPEWLTIEGEVEKKLLGVADRSQVADFIYKTFSTEEQRQRAWEEYDAYHQWRSDVALNVNKLIKEMTGAQMSEIETPRLKGQMPNLDDPRRKFIDKTKASRKMLEGVMARVQSLIKEGRIPVGVRPRELYGPDVTYKQIADEEGTEAAYQAFAADMMYYGTKDDNWWEKYESEDSSSSLPDGVQFVTE